MSKIECIRLENSCFQPEVPAGLATDFFDQSNLWLPSASSRSCKQDDSVKEVQGVCGAKYDAKNQRVLLDTQSIPSGTRTLAPLKNSKNEVLAAIDRRPILDGHGDWRLGDDGQPLLPALEEGDPRELRRKAETALNGRFKPKDHSAYIEAINAADSLDRVTILKRMEANRTFLKSVSRPAKLLMEESLLRCALWELSPIMSQAELVAWMKLSKDFGFSKPGTGTIHLLGSGDEAKPTQSSRSTEVKRPKAQSPAGLTLQLWLSNPDNADHKLTLENHFNWTKIKPILEKFLLKVAEVDAEPGLSGDQGNLHLNTKLRAQINEAQAREAENTALDELFHSSVQIRLSYLEKLCSQDDVKAFISLPPDRKQRNSLWTNRQVNQARELIQELASQDRKFVDFSPNNLIGCFFVCRAIQLGVKQFNVPRP